MEALHEIVRVLDAKRLIDAESCERRYRVRAPLDAGFYIVTWPDGTGQCRYDEWASFMGPFERLLHAEIMVRELFGHTGGAPDGPASATPWSPRDLTGQRRPASPNT